MNKKLLFGIMSLAALAACTNDDFESQQQVAEQTSPIQFEVVNANAAMRASMNGDKIAWSAADGDLFTLYHGNITAVGYQNATYKAEMDGAAAKLTTPSMIKAGKAIMVWPVDTTFANDGSAASVNISIPAEQKNIENNIPYVSDVINITADAFATNAQTAAYNTSGYARKYPIYMRPMASQLTIKADYANTDAAINALATGTDPIAPIEVTSIDLSNSGTKYTTKIALEFTAASSTETARWNAAEPNNAWSDVVSCAATATTQVQTLTAKDKCLLSGNTGCKFLILPKSVGDANSQVVVNTTYGKVVIAGTGTAYDATELGDAWYRFIGAATTAASGETKSATAETSGDNAGKYKTTASVKDGMTQTFTAIDGSVAPPSDTYVAGEYIGGSVTRYVKVLLSHLDMDGLHVKDDDQLYDAVRVWKELGLPSVTVNLDGNATTGEFEISQKTIKKINDLNAAAAAGKSFSVQPCKDAGEVCNTIVIKDGGEVQDIAFIKYNDVNDNSTLDTGENADVVLKNETTAWTLKATVTPITATSAKTVKIGDGVAKIINKGTLVSSATATIATFNATGTQNNIELQNDGTWNITGGDLTVQFNVTNYGTVNIASGAEYHQDITNGTTATTFVNDATTLPERFGVASPEIGQINNSGVFGVTGNTSVKGIINNYGLIEHLLASAKTLITNNAIGTGFGAAFAAASNKIGRINLKWDNKDEEFVSISNGAGSTQGFVSVTVDGEVSSLGTSAGALGAYVNYIIIKSGVSEIQALDAQYKYVEIADKNNAEISWKTGTTSSYTGLIILSPVNIARGTSVTASGSTYLKAKVYVGGSFTPSNYVGYYGDTSANAGYVITY